MRNFQSSRRAFLKASSGTIGALAVPVGFARARVDANQQALDHQAAYLRAVLHRQVNRSDTIRRKHVEVFVTQFGDRYGVVDYHRLYSGFVGEYRLTRLFVRSLHLTSTAGATA